MKKINWQYTLGEILIVIIGISIAFSLNKCSENSKNTDLKDQYLSSLLNDIKADKTQLENNMTSISTKIQLASEILPHLDINSSEKMSIIRKIFSIAEISNFNPKDITYQTLINSGDLKLIDDFELKTAIEAHYSEYEIMNKAYLRQENIHKEYLGSYLIENADYDKMAKGEFPFSNEKLLKNIIQSMRGSFEIKRIATQSGIKSCDSLIGMINSVQ